MCTSSVCVPTLLCPALRDAAVLSVRKLHAVLVGCIIDETRVPLFVGPYFPNRQAWLGLVVAGGWCVCIINHNCLYAKNPYYLIDLLRESWFIIIKTPDKCVITDINCQWELVFYLTVCDKLALTCVRADVRPKCTYTSILYAHRVYGNQSTIYKPLFLHTLTIYVLRKKVPTQRENI